MKLIDLTVQKFLNEVDSPSPAPGGGSVSALVIAQGISLIRMVAHLTIPKKKFQNLDEKTKLDYMSRMASLDDIKVKVIDIIDRDTLAFNKIMEAYKLPKNNPEEEDIRQKAIEKATIEATEVPFETSSLAYKALEIAYPMFEYANKSAISDFGVGAELVNSGLYGAILNVKINMVGFKDPNISKKYLDTVYSIQEKAKVLVDKIKIEVEEVLK